MRSFRLRRAAPPILTGPRVDDTPPPAASAAPAAPPAAPSAATPPDAVQLAFDRMARAQTHRVDYMRSVPALAIALVVALSAGLV